MTTLRTRRQDGTLTQVVFALVLAVVVAAALWWGFLRENAPLAPPGIRVQADFSAVHDGPAPTTFDGGQPATVAVKPDDAGAQLRIDHGRLTYRPTTQGRALAFFSSPDLRSSVKGMGARFVLRPGSGTLGAVTMIVSRGVDQRGASVISPLAINFVVTAINWNISVSQNDSSPMEVVATDSFLQPLREDGHTAYEARLTIEGAQVTIDLPGTHRRVSDPRFSEWAGSYATFELFSNHGATDSVGAFEKIWATGNEGLSRGQGYVDRRSALPRWAPTSIFAGLGGGQYSSRSQS